MDSKLITITTKIIKLTEWEPNDVGNHFNNFKIL